MQVCTSLQTDNHTRPHRAHHCFLQAGCPSCRPTYSIKAVKDIGMPKINYCWKYFLHLTRQCGDIFKAWWGEFRKQFAQNFFRILCTNWPSYSQKCRWTFSGTQRHVNHKSSNLPTTDTYLAQITTYIIQCNINVYMYIAWSQYTVHT